MAPNGGGGSRSQGKRKGEAESDVPFEFCKVCNLSHNQGRKHRYFPNHVKALSRFLSRFQEKLSELRFFLKNPSPLRPEHAALNRLWCVFCEAEIIELKSLFVCRNAIHHLASSEHLQQLKNFLYKCGGGLHHVSSFIISEADLIKWEKKCEEIYGPNLPEDIQNDFSLKNKNSSLGNSIPSFEKNFSSAVQPLQNHTIDLKKRVVNSTESPACSSSSNILEGKRVLGGQSPSANIRPPWLKESEEINITTSASVKGRTTRKLNPNRVGAAWAEKRRLEMEMERRGLKVASDFSDDWLPNFGRVWQEGTRKDSRKEFEKEKFKSQDVDSEVSIKLQPYISKRTRQDPGKNTPDAAAYKGTSYLTTKLENDPSEFCSRRWQ